MDNNNAQTQATNVAPPVNATQDAPANAASSSALNLNPTPIPNVKPPNGNKLGTKSFLVILTVLILVVLAVGGYIYLNVFGTAKKTYNANVYQPPVNQAKPTQAPSSDSQINPNDTTNQALNLDSQNVDQSLNSVNADLNSVDQGVSDQPTNLQ